MFVQLCARLWSFVSTFYGRTQHLFWSAAASPSIFIERRRYVVRLVLSCVFDFAGLELSGTYARNMLALVGMHGALSCA